MQAISASPQNLISNATQSIQDANIKSLQNGNGAKTPDKIKETAQDFEAVFLSQMVTHMFSGIKSDGPFGGGQGEEIFRGFMINEYGKLLADKGGIGLADDVQRIMLQMQEGQS